jgi:hypothetical protein
MNPMIEFAALLLTTIAAGVLALALHWLFLRAAFVLMRPAGEGRSVLASRSAARVNPASAKRIAA